MDALTSVLVWGIIIFVGVAGIFFLFKADRKVTFKFIFSFVISLVGIMMLISIVSNKFVIAFILSMIISFMQSKND